MSKNNFFLTLCITALLLVACNSRTKTVQETENGETVEDTLVSPDKSVVERAFVDFLSTLAPSTEEDLATSFTNFLVPYSTDPQAMDNIVDIAERYLADPNSPYRNEDLYIVYLNSLLALPAMSDDLLIRPRMQLERVMKNRPGTLATDFRYTTREGKSGTLLGTKAPLLVLVFYDPDCGHCTDILDQLASQTTLNQLVSAGEAKVLAVYTEGNREMWDKKKGSMPRNWTVAIDNSNIVDSALYDLPAMPTIYLLDTDKRVLLKDPTPAELDLFLTYP